MQRRSFLQHCAAAGLGFATPLGLDQLSHRAWANQEDSGYEGPFYVVFNASGGWDTTYLMDPKSIDGINRLYQQGDIKTH